MPKAEENGIVGQQIEELHAHHPRSGEEQVAGNYSPEMASEAHRFGKVFTHIDGTQSCYGDREYAFPLHSVSKVFAYALALEVDGERGRPEKRRGRGARLERRRGPGPEMEEDLCPSSGPTWGPPKPGASAARRTSANFASKVLMVRMRKNPG